MKQHFDGTESGGGQRYEPAVNALENTLAYDCLAEVRNAREAALNRKVYDMNRSIGRCGSDDNYLDEWGDLERQKQLDRAMAGVPKDDPEYDYLRWLKKQELEGSDVKAVLSK